MALSGTLYPMLTDVDHMEQANPSSLSPHIPAEWIRQRAITPQVSAEQIEVSHAYRRTNGVWIPPFLRYNYYVDNSATLLVTTLIRQLHAHESSDEIEGAVPKSFTVSHSDMVTTFFLAGVASDNIIELHDGTQERQEMTGHLHDIGKMEVPEVILRKSGKLSDEEFARIKRHPVYGFFLTLKKFRRIGQEVPHIVLAGILGHHLRWPNNRSYPFSVMSSIVRQYNVFAYLNPAEARRFGVPENIPSKDLRGHMQVITITEEEDFEVGALRIADGFEAATAPNRKNFAGRTPIQPLVEQFIGNIDKGEYSPFSDINARLIQAFANMLEIIVSDGYKGLYDLTDENIKFIHDKIKEIRAREAKQAERSVGQ